MDAIVAGLYALGHTPRKIQQVANQMTPVGVVELSAAPFRGGLHGGLFSQRLEDHLYHLIEKPSVSPPSKARLDTPSKLRPKPRALLTNRLVRHLDAALGD